MNGFFSRKKVLLVAGILAVAAGTFVGYQHLANKPAESSRRPANSINYGPPTQAERDEVQAHKEALAQQNQQSTTTPTNADGLKQITPVITNASQIQQQITINAYVGGVVEEGGVCTFTLTQGSNKITKTTTAFADASTTDCPPVFMQRSDFPSAGDWQITLVYSSSTSSGTTQSKTLTLQ